MAPAKEVKYNNPTYCISQLPEFIKLVDSTALNITNEIMFFISGVTFEEDNLTVQNIEKKLVVF